jgi:hypothetical protein
MPGPAGLVYSLDKSNAINVIIIINLGLITNPLNNPISLPETPGDNYGFYVWGFNYLAIFG